MSDSSLDNTNNNSSDVLKEFIKTIFDMEEMEKIKKRNELYKSHIEELKNDIKKLNTENIDSLIEKQGIKRAHSEELERILSEKNELEIQLKSSKMTQEWMEKELSKIDYVHVDQFNQLYWGDNYPALKLLFDYLQKMNCLDINWSYFANTMCIKNLEPINIKTFMMTKKEIGYLLSKISPFFLEEINGSISKYKVWIKRKILVDNISIDDDFIKNYIRDYKRGKPMGSEKQNQIDILVNSIGARYH